MELRKTDSLEGCVASQDPAERGETGEELHYSRGKLVPKPFSCPRCARRYVTPASLLQHRRLECGKLPTFTCLLCDYRAKLRSHLLRHLNTKHDWSPTSTPAPDGSEPDPAQSARPFACATCAKRYRHRRDLHRHRRLDCGKAPGFRCQRCAFRSNRLDSVRRHAVSMHRDDGPTALTAAMSTLPAASPTETRAERDAR